MRFWKRLRRWTALSFAAAYLLQGAVLVPLHQMEEASPHEGCESCHVHTDAPGVTPSFHSSPQHNHPLHDEHTCGLCASAHLPFTTATVVSFSVQAADPLPAFVAPTEIRSSDGILLPDSRGPPSRLS